MMGMEGIDDKYVNPYTGFGFKLLFGTPVNKELLISFLNVEDIADITGLGIEEIKDL